MGLIQVDGYWVAVVSRNGKLLGNSVPSKNKQEQEEVLKRLVAASKEPPTTSIQYDTSIATLLVELLTRPGDASVWERAGKVEVATDHAVLNALRNVGPGETVSYGELAERVYGDKRRYARAVGTAMRTNPFPLIVPCQRVIQHSGALGNYSGAGGVATKKALLDQEASVSPQKKQKV
jgi:O-6-methylguanine DNA methyltransferase